MAAQRAWRMVWPNLSWRHYSNRLDPQESQWKTWCLIQMITSISHNGTPNCWDSFFLAKNCFKFKENMPTREVFRITRSNIFWSTVFNMRGNGFYTWSQSKISFLSPLIIGSKLAFSGCCDRWLPNNSHVHSHSHLKYYIFILCIYSSWGDFEHG